MCAERQQCELVWGRVVWIRQLTTVATEWQHIFCSKHCFMLLCCWLRLQAAYFWCTEYQYTHLRRHRHRGRGSNCCYNTQYSDGKACLPCLNGGDCSKIGASVTTQSLKPGRWRASPETTDVRQCWVERACTGGADPSTSTTAGQNATSAASRGLELTTDSDVPEVIQTSKTYCAAGYQGPCEYCYTYIYPLRLSARVHSSACLALTWPVRQTIATKV